MGIARAYRGNVIREPDIIVIVRLFCDSGTNGLYSREEFCNESGLRASYRRKEGARLSNFEEVYIEQFQVVFRFLLSLTRDWALAEELTQETFYRAMKGMDGYRGTSKVSSWLCQIAKNTFYSHRRKHERIGPDEETGQEAGDGLAALLQREDSEELHQVLHDLPEPYKEVFTLRVLAMLDYGQIARLFGKSENWARVTFYRAKMKLRERMEATDDE